MTQKAYDCPIIMKQRIEGQRRIRRELYRLRTYGSKRELNAATWGLKELLNNKYDSIEVFLQGLIANESTGFILLEATRKLELVENLLIHSGYHKKRSSVEKARTLAEHLAEV
jgi:hypothetical protein